MAMNMKIGTRILLAFGLLAGLTLGLGWYALSKLDEVTATTSEVVRRDFAVLTSLSEISSGQQHLFELGARVNGLHLARRAGLKGADPQPARIRWQRAKDDLARQVPELVETIRGFEDSTVYSARTAGWRGIRKKLDEVRIALEDTGAEAEAQFGLADRAAWDELAVREVGLDELRRRLSDRIGEAVRLSREQVDLGERLTETTRSQARISILAAMGLALVVGLVAGGTLHRSITRPLAAFVEVAEKIGRGDLTQRAEVPGRDELSKLAETLNAMTDGLRELAIQSRTAAANLNSATAEIVASTQQQAASTAEQAAAVQQTNATVEELTHSGAQISERAKQVAASGEATTSSSKAGLQAVQNALRTMEAIREQAEALAENVVALSEKTQAVGEIVSSVNDIAEQTHLLALNAAIEAAAAGEHGRSFAIVAGEMKTLADQSREATVQVRTILGDIQRGINSSVMLTEEAVKRVDSGKQHSETADGTIRQMAESIQQSVHTFQQIVAGASQQQIGFEQVAQAIRSISQASAQTAAGTQQLERAAANVNALSQQLQKAVERYQV